MLAIQFDDHDTIGQWMAHHLAELVQAAHDDAATTIEQRQQIIETILNIWSHRSDYPRPAPLEEFDSILAALDRLGDDSPWRFSRLFGLATKTPELSTCGLPLVTTAAELERLTRETLLSLIWLAAQEAKEKNQDWLEVADKIVSNLESDVTTALERLQRRVARSLGAAADHSVIDADDEAELATHGMTKDAKPDVVVESGTDGSAVDSFGNTDDDDVSSPMRSINHVKRLREMAGLLNRIADALCTGPDI
jgi:hypothetical protein